MWIEHPPSGTTFQSEAKRVEWYKDSNPDHMVELHPVTQIGSLSFLAHVAAVEDGSDAFAGYGPDKLGSVLKKDLTIRRMQVDGADFVQIKGKKRGFNRWNLQARVETAAVALGSDGHRIRLTVLDGGVAVPKASNLPAVTVAGTAADTAVQSLTASDLMEFQALIRLDLDAILDQLSDTEQTIDLPVEFVVLDVK